MDDARKEDRKEELFSQLQRVYDGLTAYQDAHNKTKYGCQRSGHCCKVGLQLHVMECENIARTLQAEKSPSELKRIVADLERAFEDPEWNWASSIGDDHCAFYKDGCTIYPFRPSICRMYGVVLEVDEWCPRERLSNGQSFVYVQKDLDKLVADYYRALDAYGRMYPKRDYTVFMPAGVLHFLVGPERLAKLRERTAPKFWRRERGYRTQYRASYRRGEGLQTNVKVSFPLPR